MKITVVILTKNEEGHIEKCMNSVQWCDETLVIDDNSTDKTVALASKNGAKVYIRDLSSDFAAQRNFGLEKANGDWVLFVDADELVTKELAEEITNEIAKGGAEGYLIKRVGVFDEWILRLARKNFGKWSRDVHEIWKVNGKVLKLASPLLHSPSPSLFGFVGKLNYYSTLHAESNKKEGKKASLVKIIFLPIIKFFYMYLGKGGYLSGTKGFVFSIFMSLHSFLAWTKLWILQKEK